MRSLALGILALYVVALDPTLGFGFSPSLWATSRSRLVNRHVSLLMVGDEQPNSGPRGAQVPPQLQQPPKLNKAQERMIMNIVEKSKNSNKTKRVKFKSKARAEAQVFDLGVAENVTLGTYMTLPAEQWVTLDDKLIQRLDSGEDDSQVQYRFTMPLQNLMQLPLTATCDVAVAVDAGRRELQLSATDARLRPSTDTDGPGPAVPAGQKAPPAMPANATESIQMADMQVSFETRVRWAEAQRQRNGSLQLSTAVEVGITLPPPLSFFPGWLLRQAGGLVLRAAAGSLLPRFGQLVAEDYRRWSRGLPRLGGSLSANDTTSLDSLPDPYPAFTPPPAPASNPDPAPPPPK
mmetsp:Transcript_24432/g.48863  ORF Transcript_24432/g.48863 Transcript_24432/m.48863 type:complete len:349 (-) Transcript_24432:14-1060(-)